MLRKQMPQNPMWKKMIKDTKWFQTYAGGTKKALIMEAQTHGGTQQVICIDGGTITQVEQEEMPRILSEAASDAAKSGVCLNTNMRTMSYVVFIEEFT